MENAQQRSDLSKDSEQGVSSSTAIHAGVGFLMVVLLTLVQVKYQNKRTSPFETHALFMSLFIVFALIYTLSLLAIITTPPLVRSTNYVLVLRSVCLISGALACDSLLFILSPPLAYTVFALCVVLFVKISLDCYLHILELLRHARTVIHGWWSKLLNRLCNHRIKNWLLWNHHEDNCDQSPSNESFSEQLNCAVDNPCFEGGTSNSTIEIMPAGA